MQHLEQQRVEQDKSAQSCKRKISLQELEVVTKQKLSTEDTVKSLRTIIIKETLVSDKKQDMVGISRAAAFCKALQEKVLEQLSKTESYFDILQQSVVNLPIT